MTTQTKHTPLPWSVEPDVDMEAQIRQLDENQGTDRAWIALAICDEDGPAEIVALLHPSNASFVETAVTAHYQLVEALNEALPYLEYLATNGNPNPDASKTCDMAEAALALAEKGEQ